MYEAGELRKGLKVEIDGDPYVIMEFEFVKPGKGQALYKCKLKNMLTGSQYDHTYRSGDKVGRANLEERKMEYLYFDGENYCFMDCTTYDQIFVPRLRSLKCWTCSRKTRCAMCCFLTTGPSA